MSATAEAVQELIPAKKAVLINPLDQHVKAIEEGKQYLDRGLVKRIRQALPFEDLSEDELTLEQMLPRLSRLIHKMNTAIIGSTDTKEMRDVFNSSKDMIKLIDSLQERIDAGAQIQKIESAVMRVLANIDDNLKEEFIVALKKELA